MNTLEISKRNKNIAYAYIGLIIEYAESLKLTPDDYGPFPNFEMLQSAASVELATELLFMTRIGYHSGETDRLGWGREYWDLIVRVNEWLDQSVAKEYAKKIGWVTFDDLWWDERDKRKVVRFLRRRLKELHSDGEHN